MGKRLFQKLIRIGSLLLLAAFLFLSWTLFDLDTLYDQTRQLFSNYHWLLLMTICYLLAFIFRAIAWEKYGNEKRPFKIYLYALFYSLFFNHILPIKAGDLFRVGVLAKEENVTWDTAMHSVVVMRVLDLLCLGLFSFLGALLLSVSLSYSFFLNLVVALLLGGCIVLFYLMKARHSFYTKHMSLLQEALFHKKAMVIISLVALSWVLEAAVLFSVVRAINLDITFLNAVWVNSLTVASQVFQFAPGGLITYESTMSFALAQTEMSWKDAYHIAIITHGYKFLFSFLVGGITFLLHPISIEHLKLWKRKRGEHT
jgi:uncharacterized membrane protein YbhN (UPF0104 family)